MKARVTNTKVCVRCKKRKARDKFGNHKRTKDGLSSYCKACHREAKLATAAKYPNRYTPNGAQRDRPSYRRCSKCERSFQPEDEGQTACQSCSEVPKGARFRARANA